MIGFKEYLNEQKAGTYAAVRPSKADGLKIQDFMKHYGIPNPEHVDKLHSTLLYSRKHLPNYKPDASLSHAAEIDKFEIWPTKSGKNCLVAKMNCQSLKARHSHLMDAHKATYDYPEFKPHMSLSYDVGDYDVSQLNKSKIDKKLSLTDEYDEVLDTSGK